MRTTLKNTYMLKPSNENTVNKEKYKIFSLELRALKFSRLITARVAKYCFKQFSNKLIFNIKL